ncbi:hypothetical protein HCCG_01584 [Helicobacter cinaedi CCUG 18818 = ATCC BAA-847]|uniref:Uncharacterized protein n=1 Tax=Helicobacter cinaedi CCUG 18818 = ATCC BAA-847 TaxID=537971 RepID=A0ABN0BBU8_9HELI|nr:hypothetical protein HCCG_01584 [Helicobacter cinaedi CCUG 18818 = ATCC BAA-847]
MFLFFKILAKILKTFMRKSVKWHDFFYLKILINVYRGAYATKTQENGT